MGWATGRGTRGRCVRAVPTLMATLTLAAVAPLFFLDAVEVSTWLPRHRFLPVRLPVLVGAFFA